MVTYMINSMLIVLLVLLILQMFYTISNTKKLTKQDKIQANLLDLRHDALGIMVSKLNKLNKRDHAILKQIYQNSNDLICNFHHKHSLFGWKSFKRFVGSIVNSRVEQSRKPIANKEVEELAQRFTVIIHSAFFCIIPMLRFRLILLLISGFATVLAFLQINKFKKFLDTLVEFSRAGNENHKNGDLAHS